MTITDKQKEKWNKKIQEIEHTLAKIRLQINELADILIEVGQEKRKKEENENEGE